MMKNIEQTVERNYGLDLVRTLAISLVLLIHAISFSPAGYLSIIDGPFDYIRMFIHRICYTCVPLFVILSGYLNRHKEDPLKLYKKSGPRLVITYFFWEILITVLNVLCWGEDFSKLTIIKLFSYKVDSGRSWYMNMYFGLFLLMPFINRCWNTLDKSKKKIALCVLFLISFVSKWIFSVSSTVLGDDGNIILISNYYYGCAFVFYYLVGAYIADFHIQMRKLKCFLGLFVVVALHTLYYFVRGWGMCFQDIPNATAFWYDNPILVVEAILLFLLAYDLKISGLCKNIVSNISKQSFDMYLCSYIFDTIIYHRLFAMYNKIPVLVGIFICAILSFVVSYLAAWIKNIIFEKVSIIGRSVHHGK